MLAKLATQSAAHPNEFLQTQIVYTWHTRYP